MTESALAGGEQQLRHLTEAGKNARHASRAARVPTELRRRKGRLPGRLVIVSNRLPVALKKDDSGDGMRLLQEHLGHQSFNTTAKYRKVSGKEHAEWFARLWEKDES